MADLGNKENVSPAKHSLYAAKKTSATPSPAKKGRSKSIGPGGLEAVILGEQKQNSPDRNRRKVGSARHTILEVY